MSDAPDFEVTTVPVDGGRSIVRVRGELDVATCSRLEAELGQAPAGEQINLDLAGCTFLDSSALRVVLTGANVAAEAGGGHSLVATHPGVLRVLEIANVEERVSIHPTVESATVEQAG